ncbi:hypothetical protein K402DRAFT_19334 [Aulographum hederae CBS 113979]|uniref:Uncharacterized protein n=1 Tax=Aulographum hederae CBS 113979 TaxID=1176131 RepID=A0A6G1H6S6_9PEZI|nr:hypothetical protein K402DRAFT_19334 [Aulographum hederae CBS 113979]
MVSFSLFQTPTSHVKSLLETHASRSHFQSQISYPFPPSTKQPLHLPVQRRHLHQTAASFRLCNYLSSATAHPRVLDFKYNSTYRHIRQNFKIDDISPAHDTPPHTLPSRTNARGIVNSDFSSAELEDPTHVRQHQYLLQRLCFLKIPFRVMQRICKFYVTTLLTARGFFTE